MKYLIIFILAAICVTQKGHSQSFSTYYEVDGQLKIVHIYIDLDVTLDGIFVRKEYTQQVEGTLVDSNDVILLGQFNASDDSVSLNFTPNNYFLIPLNPPKPFYEVDKLVPAGVASGMLSVKPTTVIGDGDFLFYCNCGPYDSNDPTGCLSTIDYENGVIRCRSSTNECESYCRGYWLPGSSFGFSGGAILIQTDSSKTNFYHSLDTNLSGE